jgi:hypothetical protein
MQRESLDAFQTQQEGLMKRLSVSSKAESDGRKILLRQVESLTTQVAASAMRIEVLEKRLDALGSRPEE